MTDINVNQPFNDLRAAIKAAGGPSVRSRSEAEAWLRERTEQTAENAAKGRRVSRGLLSGFSALSSVAASVVRDFGGAGLSDARRPGSAASQGRTERWITRDKRPDNRPAILKNGFPIVSDAMHGHDPGWNNGPRPANSYRGARRNAARVLRRKTLKHIAAQRAALTA